MWLNTRERVLVVDFPKSTQGSGTNLLIGTLGDGITGRRPSLYLVGNAAQYNDPVGLHQGSGPKFYRLSGGVTDVSTVQASRWS